jgi:hypothetical protein
MTKKKGNPKKGEAEARARAIVADVRNYDYDTRRTLAQILGDKGRYRYTEKLTAMLAQAEAGELVEHPDDCEEPDWRGVGHHTVWFLERGLPDWLLQATCWVINAVAEVHHVKVMPDDGDGNYSARALGELFRVSARYQFDDLPDLTLGEHISAVLNHPNTPASLYSALSAAVGELASGREVQDSAEVIDVALRAHAAQEGGVR